ncbi:MAG: hypothetical protein JRN68_03365 [Nitrososphaerota archaeon]|jgi:predicted permease|nr:hypothetical protein [Nitrososphaerota archaeon]
MQSRGAGGFNPVFTFGDQSKAIQNRERTIRRIIQSARWNKLAVALVVAFASTVPMIGYAINPSEGGLLAADSLGLLMLFGYCILYGIQVLPGLVSAESVASLETLPLSVQDTSLISTFSFVRTMDYILIAGIVTPTILIGILTHSVLGTITELLATSVNMIFAIAISLYLAGMFYRNLSGGIHSKMESVLRLGFVLMWGLLIMGLGFFFNYVSYVAPLINTSLQDGSIAVLMVLSTLHPFSFSFMLMSSIYHQPTFFLLVSLVSICIYSVLALFAIRWSISVTATIGSYKFTAIKRHLINNYNLHTFRPMFAYALKDFRIAYRNPSTAFLVAAPVFETVVVILPLVSANVVGTLPTLIGTFIGGLFSSFTTVGLLNAEGAGFEYTKTLPIPLKTTIHAKAMTATVTFLPIPFVFAILSYLKPLTHELLYLVPIFSVFSVASASMAEITVFLAMAGAGRMVAFNASSGMLQFFLAMVVGAVIVGAPLIAFGMVELLFGNLSLSLISSGLISILEFAVMNTLISRRS